MYNDSKKQMAYWEGKNMNVHYKRDLNSNYMILTDDQIGKEKYEVRMITENRILGFLPCVSQQQEAKTEYYYEITGRQSMSLLYERRKMTHMQLREFLRELQRILEAASEYLLNPDRLLLDPEYMYLDSRTEKLYLCYYPAYEKSIRESFLGLAEYFLGKLDKGDAAGIEFGYDLYQRAMEPNFSLAEVLHRHEESEKTVVAQEEVEEEELPEVQVHVLEKTGSWRNFFRKKPKKPQIEDYLAEADQIDSGAVLFLREQGNVSTETSFLQEKKWDGLFLKSRDPEYPDFHIKESSFLIGKRKESVDGCIPVSTISRIHARITKEGSRYFLEDLNSTNGTWVDQMQLDPYELFPMEDGMRVRFASAEYEVNL